MCHGCFDIVHPGHIRHLQQAARLGHGLLVTITGDSMLGKGAGRPLIPQELRAENLAALDCVNWVAVNNRATAAELLEAIRPDVYVKGREYQHNRDPRFALEKQIVERHGGRVVFTSGDVVFSSTALINALQDSASPSQSSLRQLIVQHAITPERIEEVMAEFAERRVLVIGETIKDTYIMCERPAVAGESPIMTLRPVEHRSFDGGAAIVARHLAAMGAHPTLLTALPRSTEAASLRNRLTAVGVDARWIETECPIIEKQRFLVGPNKVMKLDLGGPLTLDVAHHDQLIEQAALLATECDAVVIADYGQALFTASVLTQLCSALRPIAPLMTGDVSGRRSNLMAMREMDLICPSESEVRDALHDYDEGLSSVMWRVMNHTRSRQAIATLGEDGLIAFSRLAHADKDPQDWQTRLSAQPVPALAPFAVDQLGCGDALLAAATLSLSAGTSLAVAAVMGSVAAAAQAQRLGNAVIGAHDLRAGMARLCAAHLTWAQQPALAMTEPVAAS
jgi:rfaE bifunctional protein nucleotidyltransferase chain/domain